VYDGFGKADENASLVTGPGIRDWPVMKPLAEHLLLTVAAFITDPVTTTDELIPSGEASSYRSNPMALAEFTLSRKDPGYVARAKASADTVPTADVLEKMSAIQPVQQEDVAFGSLVYAHKPGDGSAREQAASCQRVLGGLANIALEYATKRYRSNVVNWGMLPFVAEAVPDMAVENYVFIPGIREAVARGERSVTAYVLKEKPVGVTLHLPGLTEDEADIILHGGLINYYGKR
jgi:aconitate hydratase